MLRRGLLVLVVRLVIISIDHGSPLCASSRSLVPGSLALLIPLLLIYAAIVGQVVRPVVWGGRPVRRTVRRSFGQSNSTQPP